MHWHPAEQWGGEDSGSEISAKGKIICKFFTSIPSRPFIFVESVSCHEGEFALCPHSSALAPAQCHQKDHWVSCSVSVWTLCTSLQARLFIALSVVYCKPSSHIHTRTCTHRVKLWFQERTIGHTGSNITPVFITYSLVSFDKIYFCITSYIVNSEICDPQNTFRFCFCISKINLHFF